MHFSATSQFTSTPFPLVPSPCTPHPCWPSLFPLLPPTPTSAWPFLFTPPASPAPRCFAPRRTPAAWWCGASSASPTRTPSRPPSAGQTLAQAPGSTSPPESYAPWAPRLSPHSLHSSIRCAALGAFTPASLLCGSPLRRFAPVRFTTLPLCALGVHSLAAVLCLCGSLPRRSVPFLSQGSTAGAEPSLNPRLPATASLAGTGSRLGDRG
jgi:hypothetical protein